MLFVATPVVAVGSIGVPGKTHLLADSPDAWYDALAQLLESPQRRRDMGAAAREYALDNYSIARNAEVIANELRLAFAGAM